MNEQHENKNSLFQKILKPTYMVPVLVMLVIAGYLYSRAAFIEDTFTYHHITMDTMIELRFQASGTRNAEEIKDQVFDEIERLEVLFSRSLETSEIYELNSQAGFEPVKVSPEVLYVTKRALEYAKLTDGAFDPTIAPITDLWGFLGHEYRVPSEQQLAEKLALVDYKQLEIDIEESKIFLPEDKMALELGGIAKGFIVDQALAVLAEKGVEHAFIDAGGDIGVIGRRPDGESWRIGVRSPREKQELVTVIPVSDQAVASSGDYERAFEEDGVDYHHILDPETGMPASKLASVTIIADTVLEADALSTGIFVLGPEQGMEIIEHKPGVEGILITPDLEKNISSGLEDIIETD